MGKKIWSWAHFEQMTGKISHIAPLHHCHLHIQQHWRLLFSKEPTVKTVHKSPMDYLILLSAITYSATELVKDLTSPPPTQKRKWNEPIVASTFSPPSNFLSFSSSCFLSPTNFSPQNSKSVLTMSPLKAFFSVMRYKPSVVWILMCLISLLYLNGKHTKIHNMFGLMVLCPSYHSNYSSDCWHWQNQHPQCKAMRAALAWETELNAKTGKALTWVGQFIQNENLGTFSLLTDIKIIHVELSGSKELPFRGGCSIIAALHLWNSFSIKHPFIAALARLSTTQTNIHILSKCYQWFW